MLKSAHQSLTRGITNMASKVHPTAMSAFDVNTDIYEAARPSYTKEVVDHFIYETGLAAGSKRLVDLGCGGGKFTRLIVQRSIPNLEVIGVEPTAGMRRTFAAQVPNTEILDGNAYNIPQKDESCDVVVCAQAFHWFSNIEALTEIARVLKPGGHLALVWNMEDQSKEWVAALRKMYEVYDEGTPQYRLGIWKTPFEDPKCPFVTPLSHRQFRQDIHCSEDLVRDRVLSKSYITNLPKSEQQKVSKNVADILKSHGSQGNVQHDQAGLVIYPYTTDVFITQKKLA